MENSKPFYDLCISEKAFFPAVAKKCVELGYKTIALDHVLDISNPEQQQSGKQKGFKKGNNSYSDMVPVPKNIKGLLETTDCQGLDLNVLNRLTVIYNNKDRIQKVLQSEYFKQYHIFAVVPKTTEMFQYVCDTLDVDIVSFEPLDIRTTKVSRKMYKKAVSRGVHFEILYSPAILDQTSRRNIITKSHSLFQVGKSENIIISSGAANAFHLRGPYDIINLGLVFGLKEQQSKLAISSCCADVVNHAISRRVGKAMVVITNTYESPYKDIDSEEEEEDEQPTSKKLKTANNVINLT